MPNTAAWIPRCAAIAGVLVLVVACTSTSQATPRSSPGARAGNTPSDEPSPTPSPSPPELKITAAEFHTGEIGFAYAQARPSATGGVPPYGWSLAGGALPAGLAMDASGAISGTPSALGTFLFTLELTDAAGDTATIDTSINVVPRLVVSPTCPTNFPCRAEAGCVTVCGGFGNQLGGMPPYAYRVVAGSLPTRMGLGGLSLTGTIPAPASTSGTDWLFTVRVTDALGASAQTTAEFHVFPHIAIAPATTPCVQSGTSCTARLTYTLGTPGLQSPAVSLTPNLVNFKAPAGGGVVTFSATPPATCTKGQTYSQVVTVVLIDGSLCGPAAGTYCRSNPATVSISLQC